MVGSSLLSVCAGAGLLYAATALRGPELHLGVETLRYTIRQLDRLGYASATRPPVLVGHSNGADIAVIYASEYPGRIGMIFSPDNLRVPIPRTSQPHICSLRSDDRAPDEGVVPNDAQRRRFDIQVQATKIHHDQMWNGATIAQQRLMVNALGECLNRRSR